eukprot:m.385045 g.385045  ORF g.385045 m.385045 type:complete len:806 (-) comp16737_c2_seq7:1174-3591(-)
MPTVGEFPVDSANIPAPRPLPDSDDNDGWYELRTFAKNLLRKLPLDTAPGVDGVPNVLVSSLLRLDDDRAADLIIQSVHRLDDDFIQTDPATAPLRAILRRTKGSAFEKPNKPGQYRIIDQPCWLTGMYCRYTTRWHKEDVCSRIEPFQLGLSSGGPDAFVHIASEPHLKAIRDVESESIVTIVADVKQNYPDTDHRVAAACLSQFAPELLRMARLVSAPGSISVRRFGSTSVDLLKRENGYGQGLAASASIANVVVATLAKRVHARLLEVSQAKKFVPQDDDDAAHAGSVLQLCVTACHDNLLLHVHPLDVRAAVQILREEARKLHYRLGDWGILPTGPTETRNINEAFVFDEDVTSSSEDDVDDLMRTALLRPDQTGRACDLLMVMGVPIYGENDLDAAAQWYNNVVSEYVDFTQRVQALAETAANVQHGELSHYAPAVPAVQIASTALKSSCSFFHHIVKGFGVEGWQSFQEQLDAKIKDAVYTLHRLHDHVAYPAIDERMWGCLRRSERAGGGGYTTVIDIVAPAIISSRSGTTSLVMRACGYSSLASTGTARVLKKQIDQFAEALTTLEEEVQELQDQDREAAEAAKRAPLPYPHCAIRPEDVAKGLLGTLPELDKPATKAKPKAAKPKASSKAVKGKAKAKPKGTSLPPSSKKAQSKRPASAPLEDGRVAKKTKPDMSTQDKNLIDILKNRGLAIAPYVEGCATASEAIKKMNPPSINKLWSNVPTLKIQSDHPSSRNFGGVSEEDPARFAAAFLRNKAKGGEDRHPLLFDTDIITDCFITLGAKDFATHAKCHFGEPL